MFCVQPCSSRQVFVASDNAWGTWWGMNYFYLYNNYYFSILCYAMSSTRQIQLWSTHSSRSYSRCTLHESSPLIPHSSLHSLSIIMNVCMYACTASLSLTHDPIVISLSYIIIMDTMYNPASHAQHWSIHPFIHLPTYLFAYLPTYLPSYLCYLPTHISYHPIYLPNYLPTNPSSTPHYHQGRTHTSSRG